MELKNVYELWDRFENSTLTELHIDHQGTQLSLKKASEEAVPSSRTDSRRTVLEEVKKEAAEASSNKTIQAPLVGTFYTAPTPDAEPFVKAGSLVKKGDVIGIIEAMKLMNEVTSTEDGVVSEILVTNGNLVEYNEVLMKLE